MKTLKLSAGMPLGVKYITRDLNGFAHSWSHKPYWDKAYGGWFIERLGGMRGEVFIGDALKPGEIAKVVE